MIDIPLHIIKEKIIEKSGISPKDLEEKIKTKLEQLSGLISQEGAAHIIANELGVKLMQMQGLIKIKDLLPSMRGLEIACKVLRKYELRTFENEKRSGKLARLLVADETASTMIVMWNSAADNINKINEGDILKLKNVSVRDNNGKTEIHVSEEAVIEINPSGIEIQVKETNQTGNFLQATRKKISELKDNEQNIEIFATIVQVFDPKFFEVDSETGKRIKREEGAPPPENATYGAVLNLFADDGSDNIRVVLWKNQILNLLGIDEKELVKYQKDPSSFDAIKTDLLGVMVKFIGRVTNNQMFNRLEFVANVVIKDVDPEDEIKKLDSQKNSAPKPIVKKDNAKEKIEETSNKETHVKKENKPITSQSEDDESDLEEELLSLEDLEDLDD